METLKLNQNTKTSNKPHAGEVWYCVFGDKVSINQGYRFHGPSVEDNYYFTQVKIIQPTRDMVHSGLLCYIVDDEKNKFLSIAVHINDSFVEPSVCKYKGIGEVNCDFMRIHLRVNLNDRFRYSDETYQSVKAQIFKSLHPDLTSE